MSKNLFGISDQLINDVKSVLGEKLTGGQKAKLSYEKKMGSHNVNKDGSFHRSFSTEYDAQKYVTKNQGKTHDELSKIDETFSLGEKLTGGQKNLDVDKDGKIEASDFKKLRNKKLAAKMKKPEAGETAAHEKKEHSGPCSDDCDCMKEDILDEDKSTLEKHFSGDPQNMWTAPTGKPKPAFTEPKSKETKPKSAAAEPTRRKGEWYPAFSTPKSKSTKEEVELGEGDPIVRTKAFPGEPPEGTYADMRRKGTLPKPIQAKDENEYDKNKKETQKTFPNVKYFTKKGHPDWAKHDSMKEEAKDETDTPPWSGPSKKVPVGTVPSKSHRQKLARSGIPMKEDAIEESKQYIEVVDVSGQKKKVAVEAGKAFAALTHYRKQPNTKSARIVSEEADLEEKHLTPAEMKKREEIAKAMERENPKMPMGKKMAIATATAKKVAEEVEISEKVEVTIKKKTSDEPNVSKRDVSYDVYHDGKYHRTFKDINDAMDHKEKMQKEEYSIDEARGRPRKVKPGEEAADNEGDDTGSIVMKLRKASSIGKPVQFKDSSTHNISKSDARKALAKHDALRTSIEKEKLADRMHASHASFQDVLAGKGEPEEMTLMQKIKAARAARQ